MILAGKDVEITHAIHGGLEKQERVSECVCVCVFMPVPVLSCKIMYMCVPVVGDWGRHGAPAGNWAQASVSHLALETDVWL